MSHDKFGNNQFIASKSTEPVAYKKISKILKILKSQAITTYLPVYSNVSSTKTKAPPYTTITCRKSNKFSKFEENASYDITFNLSKKTSNGKVFVNVYLEKLKFIKTNPIYSQDSIMTFELADSDDDDDDEPTKPKNLKQNTQKIDSDVEPDSPDDTE
jgi:hypothetical protein